MLGGMRPVARKTTSAGFPPHRVAVLVQDHVVLGDLAAPVEIFGRTPDDRYEVRLCGLQKRLASQYAALEVPWPLRALSWADTVVVPGVERPELQVDAKILGALRGALARGARVTSICTGAFTLAQAGLLDGRRATTHWLAADALARAFPRVRVDASVLFLRAGQVWTSAGAAAGLDLCLHLVREDFGAAVAADVARRAVVALEREGGQAQFIVPTAPEEPGSFAPVLAWLERHLEEPLSMPQLARRAGTSVRSLHRNFRRQLGVTPARWLAQARVRRAQRLLETTRLDVEHIAERSGFASASVLRAHFTKVVGKSPMAWRRTFRPG